MGTYIFETFRKMRLSKRPKAHFQSGDHLTIDSRSSPTTICHSTPPPVKSIRQRNTSQNSSEEFFTPIGRFIPKVSGSPTSIVTTPGYDFKSRSCDGTPDSGYVDDSTFTPSSVRNSWSKTASLLVSDSKKKWKRYNAPLFHHNIGYSFKSIRPNEILPLCLFLVIFGSAVFSIFALNNALNKSAWRNNKYDSIEFGHLKTLEKEANSDLRSSAIVDENGNFLGGKKASIQFAYDMTKTGDPKDTMDNEILPVDNADMKPNFENQKVTQEEEVSPENVPKLNEDVLEKLTIQTVDKVMKLFDEIKIKEKAKPNEEKRELLRQKLSEFGHFGTSIVKPLELEIEVDASPDSKNLIPHMTIEVPEEELGFEKELENEKVVEKVEGQNLNQIKVQNPRKKRGSRQSKNGNPFRIDDAQSGRDDNNDGFQYPDDFRFGE